METQVEVRRLNSVGISVFEQYLSQRRNGEEPGAPPTELLLDEDTTEELDIEVVVEDREFDDRMEFAKYLNSAFDEPRPALEKDQGVWTWLALFYINEICPPGNRPNKLYQYVLRGDENYRHYYRHLVNGPYRLYRLHGETARSMLAGPVHQHPDMAEQIASRQEVVTNEAFIRVADYLYWDPQRQDHSVGATSRNREGNVRRLIDLHDQLERTYDLLGMDAESIEGLLPTEFDEWTPDEEIEEFNGEM